jgi:hypothetical protein
MATKNFTQFTTTTLTTSDYIVGYKANGSAEFRSQVKDIVDLVGETDSQTLSFNEANKNLAISSGNTVSLSAFVEEAQTDGIFYGRKDGAWVDITSPANLQIRRGTAAEVAAITPLEGEPVWATDTKRLFIGDGVSAGGYIINPPLFFQSFGPPYPEMSDATLVPILTATIPAQSSYNMMLFLKVDLNEDSTQLGLRIGQAQAGSNVYAPLSSGIGVSGHWNQYSSTGIVPTQTPFTNLEVVASGISGETYFIIQHFIASNATAQSVTLGLYGTADAPTVVLGTGYLKADRIS